MSLIPVGISACLTGREVRHDGGHKHSRYCTAILSHYFSFEPLCPEMGAGFGTPRPAMHLRRLSGQHEDTDLRLVTLRDAKDHTPAMTSWISKTLPGLFHLRGFILMAKSPSCGLERIRVYGDEGQVIHHQGQGLFARALQQAWPLLPVEEEGRLNDAVIRENFIERVFVFDDWQNLQAEGLTAAALIDFHTRHKFQLLAHCQKTYRELGPLLSNLKANSLETIAETYIHKVMVALKKKVSAGSHVNAMQHLLGFFRDRLEATERHLILEQIEAYQREEVPLIVPMTLLRMAQRREPLDYLALQEYLSPYPDALGLRNGL